MKNVHIDVIATTMSGSVKDWGKVKKILPLFRENGFEDVQLYSVDSHAAARKATTEAILNGGEIIISAGGSGTFNSVLEGCLDAGGDMDRLLLGFLRKGSADLLGKSLDMPDDIHDAIRTFALAIKEHRSTPCDILEARSENTNTPVRHFVGYGGAEIFGRIPYYTENRFIKYYKGILGQLFGDLGPFRVGTTLATLGRSISFPRQEWEVFVDGQLIEAGRFQAIIITNGDLGADMPFARGKPLGSGEFYAFLLHDLGWWRLPGQIRRTWNGSILRDAQQFGFTQVTVKQKLILSVPEDKEFPLNVDGSTMPCTSSVTITCSDQIHLLSSS